MREKEEMLMKLIISCSIETTFACYSMKSTKIRNLRNLLVPCWKKKIVNKVILQKMSGNIEDRRRSLNSKQCLHECKSKKLILHWSTQRQMLIENSNHARLTKWKRFFSFAVGQNRTVRTSGMSHT